MADDKFTKQLTALESQGKERFGEEGWTTAINAISRAAGPDGIPEQQMKEILKTADPAALLHTAGREQLLNESDQGNRESELAYSRMREAERAAHRTLKGR